MMRHDSPGCAKFDFDALEERFLFEKGDEFLAIDQKNMIVDRGLGAKANIIDPHVTEFQSHGRCLSSLGFYG